VRRAQRERTGLPKGFRHELISLSLLRQNGGLEEDELALHLVASHHGRCRPFAPVIGGESVVFWNGWTLSIEQAQEMACHRLDSGVAERFWKLTRTYGWWGLAYLETLLRLADWKASTREAS
jgi:CRISPR-associated endonuclease/helicase Cas3